MDTVYSTVYSRIALLSNDFFFSGQLLFAKFHQQLCSRSFQLKKPRSSSSIPHHHRFVGWWICGFVDFLFRGSQRSRLHCSRSVGPGWPEFGNSAFCFLEPFREHTT